MKHFSNAVTEVFNTLRYVQYSRHTNNAYRYIIILHCVCFLGIDEVTSYLCTYVFNNTLEYFYV